MKNIRILALLCASMLPFVTGSMLMGMNNKNKLESQIQTIAQKIEQTVGPKMIDSLLRNPSCFDNDLTMKNQHLTIKNDLLQANKKTTPNTHAQLIQEKALEIVFPKIAVKAVLKNRDIQELVIPIRDLLINQKINDTWFQLDLKGCNGNKGLGYEVTLKKLFDIINNTKKDKDINKSTKIVPKRLSGIPNSTNNNKDIIEYAFNRAWPQISKIFFDGYALIVSAEYI